MTISLSLKEVSDLDAPFSVQDGDLAFETDRVQFDAYDDRWTSAMISLTTCNNFGTVLEIAERPATWGERDHG